MAGALCTNCSASLENSGTAVALHGSLYGVCETCAVAGSIYSLLGEVTLTAETKIRVKDYLTGVLSSVQGLLASGATPVVPRHIFQAFGSEAEYLASLSAPAQEALSLSESSDSEALQQICHR